MQAWTPYRACRRGCFLEKRIIFDWKQTEKSKGGAKWNFCVVLVRSFNSEFRGKRRENLFSGDSLQDKSGNFLFLAVFIGVTRS